ncbi:MAG: beta-ketoacyl synthase N-terminal-like domain-containing protein [Bacteroidota bacterium]
MKPKIAVIGMAGLFPESHTPEAFWENLIARRDLTSRSTEDDFGSDPEFFFHKEKGALDRCYSLSGGYIRDFEFDPTGYRYQPQQLSGLDSMFQWSLHAAKEALKDSGYYQNADLLKKAGLVMGNLSFPTRTSHRLMSHFYTHLLEQGIGDLLETPDFHLAGHKQPEGSLFLNSLISGFPASVVSQGLGLGATHYALDAACASSLYAVKLAADQLIHGNADLMLAGAVSCSDPLFIHMGFSIFHAYHDHKSRFAPLDRNSGGLISSEGAGMLVLKRYEDALRDGDRVYALIGNVGLSNDGKGKFLLSPNPKGQRLALERAYESTGISPNEIDYLECHATGTPLGDVTEFGTLQAFFGEHMPKLGSAKSNLGHLLSTAGMTGLFKVILGMNKGMIPATIHIEEPLVSGGNQQAPVVRDHVPWPNGKPTKQAGVNAFGFGGTNAHTVVEEATDNPGPKHEPIQPCTLAVVGMDAHFGPCENLNEFHRSIYAGTAHHDPLPEGRWNGLEEDQQLLESYGITDASQIRGAFVEDFEFDPLRYRIPPREADRLVPQQTLLLKVADRALIDAGYDPKAKAPANVAVIVAMETELAIHQYLGRWDLGWQLHEGLKRSGVELPPEELEELEKISKNLIRYSSLEDNTASAHTGFVGNIMASRVSALWDFTGPAFTLSSGENSVAKSLEVARCLLSAGEVDAVVVGAVDLSGGMEHVLAQASARPLNTGPMTLAFDQRTNGWQPGEGAGAVVVTKHSAENNQEAYALIKEIQISHELEDAPALPPQISEQAIVSSISATLQKQGLSPEDVGYIEACASGIQHETQAELQALEEVFAGQSVGIGSAKANVGHTFAASGMAGLIRGVLCLHNEFIPGTPDWQGVVNPTNNDLFIPEFSRPWVKKPGQKSRHALVSTLGNDGAVSQIVLGEAKQVRERTSTFELEGPWPFTFTAASPQDLITQLAEFEAKVAETESFGELARVCYADANPDASFACCIIGSDANGLAREATFLQKGIQKAVETGNPWRSPAGSYFHPAPLGKDAKVAYVYPGSSSAYPGLGRELFSLFPGLYDYLESRVNEVSVLLSDDKLYPGKKLDGSTETHPGFEHDTVSMINVGVSFSSLLTHIFRYSLQLPPQAAFGYSMGESSSMLYALEVWDAHQVDTKFMHSPIFRNRIAGRMEVLAEAWNLPSEEVVKRWSTFVVMAGEKTVRPLVEPEEKVYLSFINTPDEVIISGDKAACQRIIKQLGVSFMEIHLNNIAHHEFVRSEHEGLFEMHHMPVAPQPGIDFYSGVGKTKMDITSEVLAENAAQLCFHGVDWPSQVEQVYNDGARVFIELGPNVTCTRWTKEVLKGRPHLAVATNNKGMSDRQNILQAAAQLFSHRLPLSLEALLPPAPKQRQVSPLRKRVRIGGPRVGDALKAPELIGKFHPIKTAIPQPAPVAAVPVLATASNDFNSPQPIMQNTQSTQAAPVSISSNSLPVAENGLKLQDYSDPNRLNDREVIFDEADMLEFAEGKIAKVFGDEYEIIDTYPRRVMLPMPPYLLVSRVTKLEAERGSFRPSMIQTEYDIPYDSWYATDGQIPWAVSVESGQCDLMLISYIGIDFEAKGDMVYRLLDCTLTFLDDLPFEGQTLRYDIKINNYARSGGNLLFFFSYECFVEDRMVLKMDGGCAGFFSDGDLYGGQGVVFSQEEIEARQNAEKKIFIPVLDCDRTSFSREDLMHLVKGDIHRCFGPAYFADGRNKSLRLPPEGILMLDRISKVDRQGGSWGLGYVEAELDLYPEAWFFPCHFRDDEVLAGSLQAEGGGQLLRFYMLMLGMQRLTKDARFQPIRDLPQKVRCRRQVTPKNTKLIYRMEVKEIGLVPHPYVIADLEILTEDGILTVFFENLGLQLSEKSEPAYLQPAERTLPEASKNAVMNEFDLEQFSLGSLEKCFGPRFAPLEKMRASRHPNTDLNVISRVMAVQGIETGPKEGNTIHAEYDVPADAWYVEQNASPVMPYSILMEIALQPCGLLSAWSGSTLNEPYQELFFRNLDGEGTLAQMPDLRGKTITNHVAMTMSARMGATVLQKFTYSLSVDGQTFYNGTASFGFFPAEGLQSQAGLDKGAHTAPWFEQNNLELPRTNLIMGGTRKRLFDNGTQLALGREQLDLLHELRFAPTGGKAGKGYVYGKKFVRAHDWFFTRHFYQDPVMPGSLGLEAIHQAMKAFVIEQGLVQQPANAQFTHTAPHQTEWKYRGQILSDDPIMQLEVHITDVKHHANGGLTILGDAYVWKGTMRIYEVTGMALDVQVR